MPDFLESIRQIPGPVFLKYFLAFSALCIVMSYIVKRIDGTDGLPLPDPDIYGPYEISAMRTNLYGSIGLLETALFNLFNWKLIEMDNPDNNPITLKIRRAENPPESPNLNPVEESVFEMLETPSSPLELMQKANTDSRMKAENKRIKEELQRQRLAHKDDYRFRTWSIQLVLLLVMEAFGGVKLYLGIVNHKKSGFLIALMIITGVVMFISMFQGSDLTALGRKYLKSVQDHFQWLKNSMLSEGEESPFDINPAYTVAAFGMSVLAGSALYGTLGGLFPVVTAASQDGGSGCTDCSSCSSCSSCGGGGCGGCGD